MPFADARAGWIVALIALSLAATGGLVTLSAEAGQLQNRVATLERDRVNVDEKVDRILDSLARIESRIETEDRHYPK